MDSVSVGIVIAAYNAEETLGRAIESVLAQMIIDWQLVIVDDGSTDGTLGIAQDYSRSHERITVLTQRNGGAASARNAAFLILETTYFTYLDADDELAAEWGSVMHTFVSKNPGYTIYCSDGLFVDVGDVSRPVFGYNEIHKVTLEMMLAECAILGGGALVTVEEFQDVGGFHENTYGEDYNLWLRMIAGGAKAIATPERLYYYYQNVAGRKSEDILAGSMAAIKSLQEIQGNYVLTKTQTDILEDNIRRLKVEPQMGMQAKRFREKFDVLFGKKIGAIIFNTIRPVAALIRPVRMWLVRNWK